MRPPTYHLPPLAAPHSHVYLEPDVNDSVTLPINLNVCKLWAQVVFMEFNAYMMVTNRVITFLVGFYVSTIVKRWFDQVRKSGRE